ncbi:hypothetical protein [Rhodovulum sp. MB263]|uniref:hypothetical protein n=1 Tax=Rhodovulum sp. (strain MB263) TaxID=308754 RepID=UPI0012DB5039|nr:hypothetical protein [Rhodovulum sp. MB263]
MKAAIVVGTNDPEIQNYFDDRQEAAIPKAYREGSGLAFSSLKVFRFDPHNKDGLSYREYVVRVSQRYDAVACVVGVDVYDWVDGCENLFFTTFFNFPGWQPNYQNFFSKHFSSWLKNFSEIAKAGGSQKQRTMLLLPVTAFDADELRALPRLLKDHATEGRFIRILQSYFASVGGRQTPKRKGGGDATKFYVDDRRHFFQLGLEEHAEAGELPPHDFFCRAGKFIRFGISIKDKRHFNVTEEKPKDRIHIRLKNCHGQEDDYGPKTHLNIFPNGHIE